MTTMSPGKLLGLRRLADEHGRFKMLAVDQRPPIENLVKTARAESKPRFEDVAAVKMALLGTLAPHSSAVLVDPQYVFPSCVNSVPSDSGLLITLEYDKFEETAHGRLSNSIPDWTVDKIRAAGGDAVKVLAWFRPDAAAEVREHQERFVAEIGDECRRHDIPFVFELLLYPFPDEVGHTTGYVEQPLKRSQHVIDSVARFADDRFGVDLFKLEAPFPARSIGAGEIAASDVEASFRDMNDAAGRPWVMLSAGADADSFATVLAAAFEAGASGFLAGRAIWWEACHGTFPDMSAMRHSLLTEAVPYMKRINDLTDRSARPWWDHPAYGEGGPQPPPAGDDFRRAYLADRS